MRGRKRRELMVIMNMKTRMKRIKTISIKLMRKRRNTVMMMAEKMVIKLLLL